MLNCSITNLSIRDIGGSQSAMQMKTKLGVVLLQQQRLKHES